MALRANLGPKGVSVFGVYAGPIDTDMAADVEMEKESPKSVATSVFDALERSDEEDLPDALARNWHEAWQTDAKGLEHEMGAMLTA